MKSSPSQEHAQISKHVDLFLLNWFALFPDFFSAVPSAFRSAFQVEGPSKKFLRLRVRHCDTAGAVGVSRHGVKLVPQYILSQKCASDNSIRGLGLLVDSQQKSVLFSGTFFLVWDFICDAVKLWLLVDSRTIWGSKWQGLVNISGLPQHGCGSPCRSFGEWARGWAATFHFGRMAISPFAA